MLERFISFLPSMFLILIIFFVASYKTEMNMRRYVDTPDLDHHEWLLYVQRNYLKIFMTCVAPLVLIIAPVFEEALLRLPLLIIFPELSQFAWIGIFISAGIFSYMHRKNSLLMMDEYFHSIAVHGMKSGSLLEAMAEAKSNFGTQKLKIRKAMIFLPTFILGVISGYFGIKFQSIWLCIAIHFAFNLIVGMMQVPYQVSQIKKIKLSFAPED